MQEVCSVLMCRYDFHCGGLAQASLKSKPVGFHISDKVGGTTPFVPIVLPYLSFVCLASRTFSCGIVHMLSRVLSYGVYNKTEYTISLKC